MARHFASPYNKFFWHPGVDRIHTTPNIGVSCWFNCESYTSNIAQTVVNFLASGYVDQFMFRILLYAVGAVPYLRVQVHNGVATAWNSISDSTITLGTWHHYGGLWLGTGPDGSNKIVNTRRIAYLNGVKDLDPNVSSVSNIHIRSMVTYGATVIVNNLDPLSLNAQQYAKGKIAELGIWDLTSWGVDNTEREDNWDRVMVSLARGFSPDYYPNGLRSYHRFGGAIGPKETTTRAMDAMYSSSSVGQGGNYPSFYETTIDIVEHPRIITRG